MGWFVVTVAPPSAGDAIADHVLSRANNPATWSFESLGALIYRHRRGNADAFFFCPKAALVFEPLIATNDGKPCDSPLNKTLLQSGSSRLVLGFRTNWEPIKRPERRQRARWELR
jgi:hypothetical protein